MNPGAPFLNIEFKTELKKTVFLEYIHMYHSYERLSQLINCQVLKCFIKKMEQKLKVHFLGFLKNAIFLTLTRGLSSERSQNYLF